MFFENPALILRNNMKIISNIKIKRDFENKFQSCRLEFGQPCPAKLVLGGDFYSRFTP
jgi:hypothetical protein